MNIWYWVLVSLVSALNLYLAITAGNGWLLLGLLLVFVIAYAFYIERQRAMRLAEVLKKLEEIERLTRP